MAPAESSSAPHGLARPAEAHRRARPRLPRRRGRLPSGSRLPAPHGRRERRPPRFARRPPWRRPASRSRRRRRSTGSGTGLWAPHTARPAQGPPATKRADPTDHRLPCIARVRSKPLGLPPQPRPRRSRRRALARHREGQPACIIHEMESPVRPNGGSAHAQAPYWLFSEKRMAVDKSNGTSTSVKRVDTTSPPTTTAPRPR